MIEAVFEEMKAYVGFTAVDAAALRELRPLLEPGLDRVVSRFYEAVQSHAGTRAVLDGTPEQMRRLRATLLTWLRGLFGGEYGAAYCHDRDRIGRAHVRIGLPQHFALAAMEIVRAELDALLREAAPPELEAKRAALHRLLTLEIGMMAESYKQSHTQHVRQLEREAMQARLNEAEQMAQIGQLAASLAHEIKNPLAGISGAIEVIRDSLKRTDPHWPVLGEILRQIGRVDRTVKDLLVYSRPKPPRLQKCDVAGVAERVVRIVREDPLFQKLRFDVVTPGPVPLVEADEHQLEQVLMNLVLNAAQASSEGGLVRLTTTAADEDEVRVVVEDRGSGMTPDVLRRALEPFYTTKARGTGLGLPICRKIVEAHGGQLAIRSAPGVGTIVVVELPRTAPAAGQGTDER